MAGNEELITEYIDRSGVAGDTDFFLDNLNKVNDLLNQIFSTKRSLGKNNSLSGVITQSQELATLQKQLDEQSKITIDLQKQLDAATKKLNDTRGNAVAKGREQIETNLKIRQSNKELTQDILAQSDAYKQLVVNFERAAANAKTLQAKALQTGNPDDQAAANQASDKANSLNNQLKAIDNSVGQSQRKVGSYTDALKILEGELTSVSATMSQMAAAGQKDTAAYSNLAKESVNLETIISTQKQGFSSVTQEIRSTERALQTLRAEGFGGSEAFEKLRLSVIDAAQAQKEFSRQQKLLEGEAPLLGALTLAAKGLAGAYAIGQGSVALFADGNEKVAKELNKLVAILTILQGLQEAYELIQKAGAISLAIKTSLTAAATAVEKKFATSTAASAVANTELATSEAAAATGAEAETVALGEVAVTAEGATVALGETEVAATALSTTFLATGIGAAIALIAGAIIYLLSQIPKWIEGNEITIKQQGEIADAMKLANDALIEQTNFIASLDDATKRFYDNQIALLQASGVNEEKLFDLRKKSAQASKDDAQNRIDQLGATNAQQSQLAGSIQQLNIQRQAEIDLQQKLTAIPKNLRVSAEQDQLDAAPHLIELLDKQIAAKKSLFEAGQAARKELVAANLEADKTENVQEKFYADERAKILADSYERIYDQEKSANDRIIALDTTTEPHKLEALKQNYLLEQNLTAHKIDAVKLLQAREIIDKKEAADQIAGLQLQDLLKRRKYHDDDLAERKAYFEKVLGLRTEILKSGLEFDAQAASKRVDNESLSLQDRLTALAQYSVKEQAILKADYDKERALNKGKTLELLAIDVAYYNKSNENALVNAKKQQQILQQNAKNSSELLQGQGHLDSLHNQITGLTELNDQFKAGKISIQAFNQAKEDLSNKADSDAISIQTEQLKFLRGELKNAGADKKELQSLDIQIATNEKSLLDKQVAHEEEVHNRKLERDKLEIQAAEEVFSVIKTLGDAQYERNINQIQGQIDANNKAKDIQIKNFHDSSLSATEKAAAEQSINLETAALNEQLQRKQKEEKRKEAEFDKAFSIAQIIEQTAIAVTAALKIPVYGEAEAIAIGIIGAAQIAKVAATPIPAYGFGIEDKPTSGPAWVGELHKPERIDIPGKKSIVVSTPTLMDLPKHSSVTPLPNFNHSIADNILMNTLGRNADAIQMEDLRGGLRDIKQTMEVTNSLQKQQLAAMKKKQPIHIHTHVDGDFWNHINKSV